MLVELLWEMIKFVAPALTGGGATLLIQWLVNRRKVNAESKGINADTESKSYDTWKAGYQETRESFEKLLERVVEVEMQLTEALISVRKLKLENDDLKQQLERSERIIHTLRLKLEEIVKDGQEG